MKFKQLKHEDVVRGDDITSTSDEVPGVKGSNISMTDSIELECPIGGCNHGVAGAKYKTPKLGHDMALQMMEMHAKSHDQGRGGDQQRQEPGNECFT